MSVHSRCPARRLAAFRPPEPAATTQQLTDELANWTLMPAHVAGPR
ncbi:hypothetical protein ACIQ1J_09735 [Streptomyces sp. NPDC097107]